MKRTLLFFILSAGAVFLSGCDAATGSAEKNHEKFTSMAKWVYCGPADNPATNAYLRYSLDIGKKVAKAYLRLNMEKGGNVYINGEKVSPVLWPPSREFFGHIKAFEVDFTAKVRPGKNVIAVRLNDSTTIATCRGLILRGVIDFADGGKLDLASGASTVKAVADNQSGWNELLFDDSHWPAAIEVGDVFCPPWSRWGNLPECFCMGEELERYRSWHGREQSRMEFSSLAGESENPDAKIVYSGDIPGIQVAGKTYAPVIDMHVEFSDSSWRRKDLRNMRSSGVRFISVEGINRFRVGEGKYDFAILDQQMMEILKEYPEAYFFFCYGSGVYSAEWARNHPDECAGFAVPHKEQNIHNYWCTKPAPSFASKLYRERGAKIISEFGEYIRSRPWGRRVVGVWTAFGGSGDGMPAGCYSLPDTGVAMTKAFRRYLARKYKTDAGLQRAWGDSAVTLESAKVPGKIERNGWGGYIRDRSLPGDRMVDDYYDCYHKEFSDYILALGKAVKTALPGRLSGAYHGYVVLSYNPEGSTARCEEILASPYVDMLFATTRGYNLTDGLHRNLHSLCRRYGKLSTIEGDIRTHLCYRHQQSQAHWSCKTPDETRATYSKIAANSLMLGAGYHIVGFNAYTNINTKLVWTDCPEVHEPVSAGIKAWADLFANPPAKAADVAVVLDHNEVWRNGHPEYWKSSRTADNIVVYPLQTLNFCGYAYDLLSPADFADSTRDYKAVVFLNTFNVSDDMRKRLVAKTRRSGVTAIWHFAPGLQTEDGFSARSMSELTGIDLDFRREVLPLDAKNDAGGIYRFWQVPAVFNEGPRVFSRDPAAKVFARWIDDGTAAHVVKTLDGGARSIFVGVPTRSAKAWAKMFAEAGCHAFTEPGFMVKRNSRLLELFSGKNCTIPPESAVQRGQISQSGKCEVKLERRYSLVRDILTGEVVARDTDSFTLESEQPKLWLLETK
jgi:hypothetical protein